MRLDTYSGAPIDFAAYNVDPADVIIAGATRTTRAIDTAHRKALVRWRFSPPPGYRFETSDVAVPLGAREGFYVIEARRGDAVQQVWINRTSLGLLTQESPDGIVVWCADLRSGRALAGVEAAFLVGSRLVSKRTGADGAIVWRDPARPSFVLAERGASRAFVSILPQAPPPATLVGLRLDSAVARAGDRVRFIGFARKRTGTAYRRAVGTARVNLLGRGKTLATTLARVDAAGAFSGELAVPPAIDAGDYAVLATVAGGVGGTSVRVDAVSDVALAVVSTCPCEADRDIPIAIEARRAGAPADVNARVTIVRTPHVVPPGAADDAVRWGTTVVFERTIRTAENGIARLTIPSPSDGLDSSYGIRATTRGASATARVVVAANPRLALALEPETTTADVGAPVAFDLRAFDPSDGAPLANIAVRVRLSHGASLQNQDVVLDARGRARVVFRQTSLGTNLAIAEATSGARPALDAAAVIVEPSALGERVANDGNGGVAIELDRARYPAGATVAVRASAPGATGDAFVTLAGARTYAMRRAGVRDASATASFQLGDAQGAVVVTAAFVRDGALALGSSDVRLDGPGHARTTDVTLDKSVYAPGETLHAIVHDGAAPPGATIALRVADGRESGPALFEDAPDLLRTGATSAQAPASSDPQWHAYVEPARSKASDIFAAERPRKASTDVPSLGVAAPRTMLWRVVRAAGDALEVPVPKGRGHYVLSILKIGDAGEIGAASVSFNVE